MDISIRNLRVSYRGDKGFEVLHVRELDISRGSITALYGPNHVGKSSLLKVIAGDFTRAIKKAGSTVLYADKEVQEIPAQSISYLPQRFAETLFPWFSVDDNLCIRLIAANLLTSPTASHVERLWDKLREHLPGSSGMSVHEYFGLDRDGKQRPVDRLSGGQQQTIALLRALIPTPSLLLLDEPFSAIDIYKGTSLRRALLHYIEAEEVTTIIITHDLGEAIDLCDQIIVLSADRGAGDSIANTYKVGTPRPGPNIEGSERTELLRRIMAENGLH